MLSKQQYPFPISSSKTVLNCIVILSRSRLGFVLPALFATFCAGFFIGLFVDPYDGSDMFLLNVIDFQRTTQGYIPEDITLHNHRCENLRSFILKVTFFQNEPKLYSFKNFNPDPNSK
jgi:hypothetical protein